MACPSKYTYSGFLVEQMQCNNAMWNLISIICYEFGFLNNSDFYFQFLPFAWGLLTVNTWIFSVTVGGTVLTTNVYVVLLRLFLDKHTYPCGSFGIQHITHVVTTVQLLHFADFLYWKVVQWECFQLKRQLHMVFCLDKQLNSIDIHLMFFVFFLWSLNICM